MIIGVWIGAFVAAIPVFFIVVVNKLDLPEGYDNPNWNVTYDNRLPVTYDGLTIVGTELCAMDSKAPGAQRTFIISAFCVFFLFPGEYWRGSIKSTNSSTCDYGCLLSHHDEASNNRRISGGGTAKEKQAQKESSENTRYAFNEFKGIQAFQLPL
jgi:hypothetical protein